MGGNYGTLGIGTPLDKYSAAQAEESEDGEDIDDEVVDVNIGKVQL